MLVLESLPLSAQMGMRVFLDEDDGTCMVLGPGWGRLQLILSVWPKGGALPVGREAKPYNRINP